MNAAELIANSGALANKSLLLWLLTLVSLLSVVLAVLLLRLDRLNRQFRADHELREQERRHQAESHQLLRNLIDHLPQLITAKDQKGVYIECNQSYLDFLGLTREAVIGKRAQDLFAHNDIQRSIEEQDDQVRMSRSSHTQSRWLSGKDQELRLITTDKLPLMDDVDRLWGVLSISEDTTADNRMRQLDKHRNRVLEQLAHGAPLQKIFDDLVCFTEELYPGLLCSILLLDERDQSLRLGSAPSLPDFYNDAVDGLLIGEGVGSCGTAAFTGRPIIVGDIQCHPYWKRYTDLAAKAGLAACWSMPVKNRQGSVLGTFAIYYSEPSDPTPEQMELMMVNAHLAAIAIESAKMDEQLSQLSQAVEHSASFVMIADSQQRIDYVNHSLIEATGYSLDQLKGLPMSWLAAEDDPSGLQDSIRRTVQKGETWHGERRFKGKSGPGFWVMSSVAPIRNTDNEITHLVCVSEDITALKQEQERMARLAFYDPLTGLANRRLFKDRLDVVLKQAQRQQQSLALLYMDLDRFKAVNDEYGHEVGDELLKEVAQRLEKTLRESDVIARIGGDEFNIILTDIADAEAAEQVADKVLQAVIEPFVSGNIELQISTSIGLTLYPDDAVDGKQLIKNADVAMYRSKAQGRNCRLRYTG